MSRRGAVLSLIGKVESGLKGIDRSFGGNRFLKGYIRITTPAACRLSRDARTGDRIQCMRSAVIADELPKDVVVQGIQFAARIVAGDEAVNVIAAFQPRANVVEQLVVESDHLLRTTETGGDFTIGLPSQDSCFNHPPDGRFHVLENHIRQGHGSRKRLHFMKQPFVKFARAEQFDEPAKSAYPPCSFIPVNFPGRGDPAINVVGGAQPDSFWRSKGLLSIKAVVKIFGGGADRFHIANADGEFDCFSGRTRPELLRVRQISAIAELTRRLLELGAVPLRTSATKLNQPQFGAIEKTPHARTDAGT